MLCGRNYHVLTPISNHTSMNTCSDIFFFVLYMFLWSSLPEKQMFLGRFITAQSHTPCAGISRGRLISSASCLRHIRSSFPALQPRWAPHTGSKEGKAALPQSIYIKGLTLQSKGSAERGYKQINITARKQS